MGRLVFHVCTSDLDLVEQCGVVQWLSGNVMVAVVVVTVVSCSSSPAVASVVASWGSWRRTPTFAGTWRSALSQPSAPRSRGHVRRAALLGPQSVQLQCQM